MENAVSGVPPWGWQKSATPLFAKVDEFGAEDWH